MNSHEHTAEFITDTRVWAIERQVDGIMQVDYVRKCYEDDGSVYYGVRHPLSHYTSNEHYSHTIEQALAWYERQLQRAAI